MQHVAESSVHGRHAERCGTAAGARHAALPLTLFGCFNALRRYRMKTLKLSCLCLLAVLASPLAGYAFDDPVECQSAARQVKAIRLQDYHPITTQFQFDTPNLEPLLSTTVEVQGKDESCIIAHFSAHARVTDNYIVFQVLVDGEPMEGHLSGAASVATPVVITNIQDYNEQLTKFPRIVSYNFFKKVRPGTHTITILVAAGSAIDATVPGNIPSVGSPVLTLEYR